MTSIKFFDTENPDTYIEVKANGSWVELSVDIDGLDDIWFINIDKDDLPKLISTLQEIQKENSL